jgi:anti-sigma B factor antagonist
MVRGGSDWPEQLHVRRLDMESAVCLALEGELDLASVADLNKQLTAAARTEKHLVVEMSGLRYIDSTGAKALLDAHRIFKQTGRKIALAAVSPMTRRILTVLGVEQVLPVFPTVEAALASF